VVDHTPEKNDFKENGPKQSEWNPEERPKRLLAIYDESHDNQR
jgi:hypothetical protein